MKNFKFHCKSCKKIFNSLDEWTGHNTDCNSYGYEKVLIITKKEAPAPKPKNAIKSSPKPAEANEQELKASKSTKKTAKKLKADLDGESVEG